MNKPFGIILLLILGLFFSPSTTAFAQPDGQVEALKVALVGQRMLITYREGGALYGTYYFLDVQFCRTGKYITSAQSHKTTVMDNDQSNNWTEIGRWDILSYQNQPVLRYVTLQGKMNFVPARLLQDGEIWLGDGVTVRHLSTTACK
jgi:hypothetical protein